MSPSQATRYIRMKLFILLIPGCPWYNSNNNCLLPGGVTKTIEPTNIQLFKVYTSAFHLTNCFSSSGHIFGQHFVYTCRCKIRLDPCFPENVLSTVLVLFSSHPGNNLVQVDDERIATEGHLSNSISTVSLQCKQSIV